MRDGLILHAIEGALGGALGTMAVQQTLRQSFRLPEAIQPPEMREDPGEFVTQELERARGHVLARPIHRAVSQGLHWAYGVTWGTMLGIFASKAKVRGAGHAVAAGAAMGAIVWAVGFAGWLPATKLTKPVRQQGAGHIASSLASHVMYGLLAAMPIAIIDGLRERRRSRWWRFG